MEASGRIGAVLAMYLMAPLPCAGQNASGALEAQGTIDVRPTNDGAGPSQLLLIGGYLLVVDPREGVIRRYPQGAFGAMAVPTAQCSFARTFAPWRSVLGTSGIALIDEDDRKAMRLGLAEVRAMGTASLCPVPKPTNGETDRPPRLDRIGEGNRVLTIPNGGSPRTALKIDAGRFGEILGARPIGTLGDGRRVVIWKRLDRLPKAGERLPSGATYDLQGRVVVSVLVTVFSRGGRSQATVRLEDFSPAGHRSTWGPGVDLAGMHKRAFEYAVAGSDASGNWLYVLRDRGEVFRVERYRLPRTDAGKGMTSLISLASGSAPEPSEGADGDPDDASQPSVDVIRSRQEWDAELQRRVDAYAKDLVWHVPTDMGGRPCANGSDECTVMLSPAGAIVERPAGDPLPAGHLAIAQDHDGDRAIWKRPTQLRGLPPGATVGGMPYSFGGDSTPQRFLEAVQGAASADTPRPPIGHIRTALTTRSLTGAKGQVPSGAYPLGIDCSRFVAHILGAAAIPTGGVVDGEHGVLHPPGGAFPLPIEHASQLKPGDLLVKNGHIVIYRRTVYIGYRSDAGGLASARRHGSIGYEVYEASSRCGRTCRSVYELDFFNGWWMFRPMRMSRPGSPTILNPYGAPAWTSAPVPQELSTQAASNP